MHGYVQRIAEEELGNCLKRSPVTVVTGPRQCGKSTLAKKCIVGRDAVYLDLQDRVDLNKVQEPELFFDQNRKKLICLDEIQRVPEFFSLLRSEIDRDRRPGRFLILGSASRDLLRQSNESLAGRAAFLELTPFQFSEVATGVDLQTYWCRGGFPESTLAGSQHNSELWRKDFAATFLERDIPSLGFSIPAPVMGRIWRMLAHYHGQVINYSKLAEALDLTVPTVKKYLSLLEQTYMVRILEPFSSNLKKRLVKSPKVYIRDSGMLHHLLDIGAYNDLLGSTMLGASWEGMAVENIINSMPDYRPSYLRTSNGAEVDLIMEKGDEIELFECKASKAPKPSRGFSEMVKDLAPSRVRVVSPVDETYEYKKGITVTNLAGLRMQGS